MDHVACRVEGMQESGSGERDAASTGFKWHHPFSFCLLIRLLLFLLLFNLLIIASLIYTWVDMQGSIQLDSRFAKPTDLVIG